MRPATPAAASRWPMFAFTDPIMQRRIGGPRLAEHARQRLDLDRIAERRAGAVRLHIADLVRRHSCIGQCLADHRLLRGAVGRGEPVAAAVLIRGGATDHGDDAIAVGACVAPAA